ncbi:MAG: FAD:protein FMN transferase [Blautia sp.]|nr:FAD:protein FMN transferase [Blautia sp.]
MVIKRIEKVIQAFALIVVVSLIATSGCGSKKAEKYDRMFFAFDTVISLSIYSAEDGEALLDKCVEMCTEIEEIFSRTKQESELYRINHRDTDTVAISDEIRKVLEVGFQYHKLSEGLFDFTVAPLSDLWDFKSEDAVVPPEEMIAAAVKKVDADLVQLKGNQLVFQSRDTMIDLGALVKGYAADQMKTFLKQEGVEHGLLNLGGNVLTIGAKPDGQPWNIGIQKPFGEQNSTADIVQVSDKSVVSSGIYERYLEQDGVIYHHILNPRTGYSVDNEIAGVSVICDSSLEGDALSTTCLMLGVEKATSLIQSRKDAEAVFVLKDGTVVKTRQQATTP